MWSGFRSVHGASCLGCESSASPLSLVSFEKGLPFLCALRFVYFGELGARHRPHYQASVFGFTFVLKECAFEYSIIGYPRHGSCRTFFFFFLV